MEDFAGVWEVVLWALAAVVKFVFTPSAMVARGVDAPTTVAVTTVVLSEVTTLPPLSCSDTLG